MSMLFGLLLAVVSPSPGSTLPVKTQSVKPDFSNVTSKSQVDELVKQRKLVRIYLFPVEFGGPEEPMNRSSITPEAAAARELILGTMKRFIQQGLIDKMTVSPEYRGASLVPTRIVFHASNSKTGGTFEPTVEVW
jgi:hypothetical protein